MDEHNRGVNTRGWNELGIGNQRTFINQYYPEGSGIDLTR